VIPRDYTTSWRAKVPWVQDFQVEQDLVISRALVEIYSKRDLSAALAFRGGTALHKLHMKPRRGIPRTSISYRYGQERLDRHLRRCAAFSIPGSASRSGNRVKGA
jgi:hypothetical protein